LVQVRAHQGVPGPAPSGDPRQLRSDRLQQEGRQAQRRPQLKEHRHTPGRLLELLDQDRITDHTPEVRLRIAAEPDFNPQKDIDLESLRFGAPEEVDFGRGARLLRTVSDGEDLVAVFSGNGTGFADHNFAGKLLGRTAEGKLLFGYCRLPWVEYDEPILSARRPETALRAGRRVLKVEVSNHGQVASQPSKLRVAAEGMPEALATCPALPPYGKTVVVVVLPDVYESGHSYDLQITTGLHIQQPMVFVANEVKLP